MVALTHGSLSSKVNADTELTRDCPACNSSRARSCGEKNGFKLLLCNECGTLYTRTLPKGATEAYDGYYSEENLSVPEFIDRRLDEIVSEFSGYRQNNRFLDLGCGAGSLIKAATRAGWRAEGLDVSPQAVQHLRSIGFNAFCGELHEAAFPTAYFDVVAASELVEHVSDPSLLLGEISRVLRPGGLFWATTPHSHGVSGRMLGNSWSTVAPPEHLHLFSVRGFDRLLTRNGFRRVRIKTEGVNPSELLKVLRRRPSGVSAVAVNEGTKNVHSSYRWNETLLSSTHGRLLKSAVNAALRASKLGDSLKIWAER